MNCQEKLVAAVSLAMTCTVAFYIVLYIYLIYRGLQSPAAKSQPDIPSWLNVSTPTFLKSKGPKGGGFGTDPFWGPISLSDRTNKCWDVVGGPKSKKNGSNIQIADCNKAANQSFFYDADKEQIRVQNSNYCVDLPKNVQKNGQQLDIWECNNGANQKWVQSSDNFQLDGTDFCIDLTNNNANKGTKLQLYECNNSAGQSWAHTKMT